MPLHKTAQPGSYAASLQTAKVSSAESESKIVNRQAFPDTQFPAERACLEYSVPISHKRYSPVVYGTKGQQTCCFAFLLHSSRIEESFEVDSALCRQCVIFLIFCPMSNITNTGLIFFYPHRIWLVPPCTFEIIIQALHNITSATPAVSCPSVLLQIHINPFVCIEWPYKNSSGILP